MCFRRELLALAALCWAVGSWAAQIGCQSGDPGDVLVCQSGGIAQWAPPVQETESDPVFAESPAAGITGALIAQWSATTAALAAHVAADDPHPTYLTAARGDARYSPLNHGHAIGNVSGLQAALDAKLAAGAPAGGITAADLADWDAAAAGRRAWVDLGDATDVSLSQHGATVEARLVGNGELTLVPPTDGAYYTTLILSTASPTGAYELTALGSVGWLAGSAGLRPEPGRDVELVCLQTPARAVCSAAYVELP